MKLDTGVYILRYTARDGCGNEDKRERKLKVVAKTVLYSDGTFIINEKPCDREANIAQHGSVIKEYEPLTATNLYDFDSRTQRPWHGEEGKIKKVMFGSGVAPNSLSYWFQNTNLESIDWHNFSGAIVTKADRFAASTKLKKIIFPQMPCLSTLRYAFNRCYNLEIADFSRVNTTEMCDLQDVFQGCYSLTEINITGLAGTVTASDRAFANVLGDGNGDMNIKTIYASKNLTFESGANMFRSCVHIEGSNGTIYDANKIDYAMAHMDETDDPGYFSNRWVWEGVDDITIDAGSDFDPLNGVRAYGSKEAEIEVEVI